MFFTKCPKSKGLRVHLFRWDNLQNLWLPHCIFISIFICKCFCKFERVCIALFVRVHLPCVTIPSFLIRVYERFSSCEIFLEKKKELNTGPSCKYGSVIRSFTARGFNYSRTACLTTKVPYQMPLYCLCVWGNFSASTFFTSVFLDERLMSVSNNFIHGM